ncbi:hypothetical protein [Cellulomonas sp. Y8]|uniref:hypothetical protein n=1 Tax=Cellulomonas sp. Y8 TaxID=2591145 RepID=UPI0011C7FF91|nr:hypothetical protein [Cellulomonas sp. Y8]
MAEVLGADGRGDVRRAQWLIARAGYTLEQLKRLTPGERWDLRRCLGVSQLEVVLLAYYPIVCAVIVSWAVGAARESGAPTVAGLLAFMFAVLVAAVFMLVWQAWMWATVRWGEADRQLGLVVRRILVRQGALDRGAVGRLRGRRDVLLLGRKVPGLLLRGEADPSAAAGLQADLREGADPRPVCRELLADHLRGALLDPRIVVAPERPVPLTSEIPQWIIKLAAMAPAVLLILGLFGYPGSASR